MLRELLKFDGPRQYKEIMKVGMMRVGRPENHHIPPAIATLERLEV
jgi:hypothetical protein